MTNPARPTYEHPHISVDNHDGQVLLTVYTDILTGDAFVLQLGPGEALTLLTQLVSHSGYATVSAARALYVGDCDTCKNTRLVDTNDHGRRSNKRCPDCAARWNESSSHNDERFPPYPRVGGGVR